MRADEILMAHRELLARTSQPVFAEVVTATLVQVDTGTGQGRFTEIDRERAEEQFEILTNHIRGAYTYRVTEDMVDLVNAAAEQLDATDQFDRDLAPTGCGIVRFEKPLSLWDVRGRELLVSWVIWGPVASLDTGQGKPGIAFWAFNDMHTHPDVGTINLLTTYPNFTDAMGRWGFIGATLVVNGESLREHEIPVREETKRSIREEGDDPADTYTNFARHLHALWLLLNQTIVSAEEEVAARHVRKAMGRMHLPDKVTVIHLRRTEGTTSPDESQVEWQHRWIVRGHWAWRHCSPDNPNAQPYKGDPELGTGVRVWIAPYVKGPEGKPLVVTDKLYSLER